MKFIARGLGPQQCGCRPRLVQLTVLGKPAPSNRLNLAVIGCLLLRMPQGLDRIVQFGPELGPILRGKQRIVIPLAQSKGSHAGIDQLLPGDGGRRARRLPWRVAPA